MRTPVTTAQGLELANSLIKGKTVEKKLEKWKAKYSHGYRLNGAIKLGKTYWKIFLKQNSHLIRAKKTVKFDSKRADWCNYLNMEEMYHEIYKNLCSAGIACEHPEAQWRDKNGDVVETEDEAFGCKTRYELIHPDHFIFVDEVGNNTSQAKDGQVRGQPICAPRTVDPNNKQQLRMRTSPFWVLQLPMESLFSVLLYLQQKQ